MDGDLNPASIAASISIGTSVLAGLISMVVAIRSRKDTDVSRDAVVSILFCVAFLLILLNITAATFVALWGMAYIGLIKAALLLTAAFAVAGMAFGLVRGLRSTKAIKTRSA